MFNEEQDASPTGLNAAVSLPNDTEWHTILHASNQVVLYNPTSHALSVQHHSPAPDVAGVVRRPHSRERCPYCHRPMDEDTLSASEFDEEIERVEDDIPTSRAANYFQLLQVANESSVPPTPRSPSPADGINGRSESDEFQAENMAEGYFKTFFREECRLGMGANGSVFLCEVSICV